MDLVRGALRFMARHQFVRMRMKLQAIRRGVQGIARFHAHTKQRREAQVRALVKGWKTFESAKRQRCARAAARRHEKTLMSVAQDYAVYFVPDEMKSEAANFVYWERTRELQQEYRRWLGRYKRSQAQYAQVLRGGLICGVECLAGACPAAATSRLRTWQRV